MFAEEEVELPMRTPLRNNANPLCNIEEASDVLDTAQNKGFQKEGFSKRRGFVFGGSRTGRKQEMQKKMLQREAAGERWDEMIMWLETS